MSRNYRNIPLSSDGGGGDKEKGETSENDAEALVEPLALSLKKSPIQEYCNLGEWGEWSPCIPDNGSCGIGTQIRQRNTNHTRRYNDRQSEYAPSVDCQNVQNGRPVESQSCSIDCTIKNME